MNAMKTITSITVFALFATLCTGPVDWSSWLRGLVCGAVAAAWVVYFALKGRK
jgi:hypothetical protein